LLRGPLALRRTLLGWPLLALGRTLLALLGWPLLALGAGLT